MSGLAAGIRLAMFDKKVVILEKHSISGGLNSYYQRRISSTKEILPLDVGLHALTNFARKGERRKPFTKLLKQLRIPYEAFQLKEQSYSLIKFPDKEIKFSNDFSLLEQEIFENFPSEVDNFKKFCAYVSEYNEVDLNAKYIASRKVLGEYFKSQLLIEMLIAPLLIYGSAWENDMDFSQFVIMFKSLYFEGFSRPVGGVRTILNLLLDRYKELGGELRFRSEVVGIHEKNNTIQAVELKNGEILKTDKILSSVGLPETQSLVQRGEVNAGIGKLSFTESIIVAKNKACLKNQDATIIFYNSKPAYTYEKPKGLVDTSSAVFCLPDNYDRINQDGHAMMRITYMANYDLWKALEKEEYKTQKNYVFNSALELSYSLLGHKFEPIFSDVFSPTTIEKYTFHKKGTVYGSTDKTRNGKTHINGLFIIGTDQGFLGIVGSMLSGISMANLYGLMDE